MATEKRQTVTSVSEDVVGTSQAYCPQPRPLRHLPSADMCVVVSSARALEAHFLGLWSGALCFF